MERKTIQEEISHVTYIDIEVKVVVEVDEVE